MDSSTASVDSADLQANLHVMERRMIAFLHQAFSSLGSSSTGMDKLLSRLSGSSSLPLPGLLEAWQLAELARLHNSSATLFRAEIKRALAAHAPPANKCQAAPLAKPHSDTELMMILDAADADSSSWILLHNLLSLQLFHLQRASALTRELKLRQQQQQARRLKRCATAPELATAGRGVPRRSSNARYPRRSFELQLPAVYE